MDTKQLEPGADTINPLPKGQYAGQSIAVRGGNILPANVQELLDYAQMMSKGSVALPAHFRGQPGVCLAIIKKAMRWEMDEWEVANSTYMVNNRLAYEAGLIAAVVKKWAPVKEKVWAPIYKGEADKRTCTITVHHAETGEEISYTSPIIGKMLPANVKEPPTDYVGIWPKNSPLWRFEPDQQLYYYSTRAMARRFFPDILRGVYDREEVLTMKDITPASEVRNFLNEDDLPPLEGDVLPPETPPPSKPEPAREASRKAVNTPEPELIQQNLIKAIKRETDAVRLEQWQRANYANINTLPEHLRPEVRKALSDRYAELEGL
jgi:hypothetical protein